MIEPSVGQRISRRQWALWAAYAAFGWAALFAALSFFWAAGGRTGLQPLEQVGGGNAALWALVNVFAGLAKLGGGALAIILVRMRQETRGARLLGWLLLVGGVGMCLYGGLGLISDALHVSGVINDPATRKWFFYYLVLWDPWWALGGALFTATALLSRPMHAKVAVAAH